MKYMVIAAGAPLDSMLKTDFAKAVQRAEMWADHLRADVSVVEINGVEVRVAHIAFYTPKE